MILRSHFIILTTAFLSAAYAALLPPCALDTNPSLLESIDITNKSTPIGLISTPDLNPASILPIPGVPGDPTQPPIFLSFINIPGAHYVDPAVLLSAVTSLLENFRAKPPDAELTRPLRLRYSGPRGEIDFAFSTNEQPGIPRFLNNKDMCRVLSVLRIFLPGEASRELKFGIFYNLHQPPSGLVLLALRWRASAL